MLGFAAYSAPEAGASVSSITIDAASGEVLSSSAADTLRYPASLTKVMTLYITFDALEKGIIKLDDKLPVSRHAANRSPSKLGLRAGSSIDVKPASWPSLSNLPTTALRFWPKVSVTAKKILPNR